MLDDTWHLTNQPLEQKSKILFLFYKNKNVFICFSLEDYDEYKREPKMLNKHSRDILNKQELISYYKRIVLRYVPFL